LISILKDDWIVLFQYGSVPEFIREGMSAVPSMHLRHPRCCSSLLSPRRVRLPTCNSETSVYAIARLRELAADFSLSTQRAPKPRAVIGLSLPESCSLAVHDGGFELVAGISRHFA
jgi:hypothetical protein